MADYYLPAVSCGASILLIVYSSSILMMFGCVLQHGLRHGSEGGVLPSGGVRHVRAHGFVGDRTWRPVLTHSRSCVHFCTHRTLPYQIISSVLLLVVVFVVLLVFFL